jgi:hypothetical protein
MANEVTSNLRLQLASGVVKNDFNPGRIQVDYTPLVIYHKRHLITTGEVTITHGVTNPRFCILYNHDATNYVEGGTTTTDYPIYLRASSVPTQFEIGPAKASIYLKANTASCYVDVIVY